MVNWKEVALRVAVVGGEWQLCKGQVIEDDLLRRLPAPLTTRHPAPFQFDQQANSEYSYKSASDCVEFFL